MYNAQFVILFRFLLRYFYLYHHYNFCVIQLFIFSFPLFDFRSNKVRDYYPYQ